MKRSRAINLVLLVSSVAALEACGQRRCIDKDNVVVDQRYCQDQTAGTYGYRWYTSSYGSGATIGTHVNPSSGTVSGVFGGAGDAAGHGGSGAGE